jgi:sensor domain CHASE-containing protein
MGRRVKDFIEIKDIPSLDALIEKLIEIRDSLPPAADAEVKIRGDDIFGRQLAISFFRPQTAEEAECEARYAAAYRESREKELSKLQEELGMVCRPQEGRRLRLAS